MERLFVKEIERGRERDIHGINYLYWEFGFKFFYRTSDVKRCILLFLLQISCATIWLLMCCKLGLNLIYEQFLYQAETLHLCRYARSVPNSALNLLPYNLPKVQPSFAQYDTAFNQMGQISQTQASLGYVPPSSPIMRPFCAAGLNQSSGEAAYLQWPSPAVMYAHSYDQFRHAVFQVSVS